MANDQLFEWVQNGKAQGYTSAQLYSSLLQQGYSPEEVNPILQRVFSENTAAAPASAVSSTVVKTPMNLLPFIIGGVALIIVVQIGLFFFFSKDKGAAPAEEPAIVADESVIAEEVPDTMIATSTEDIAEEEEESEDEEDTSATSTDAVVAGEEDSIDEMVSAGVCAKLSESLLTCTPYKCSGPHLLLRNVDITREVKGMKDGKCEYFESMPNDSGEMNCSFSDVGQKSFSDFYIGFFAVLAGEKSFIIDGKTITEDDKELSDKYSDAFQSAMEKECVVSAKAAEDTVSFPEECPFCENCDDGKMTPVIVDGEPSCQECLFDSSCKEGFSCVNEKCIDTTKSKIGDACSFNQHCPSGAHCGPEDLCLSDALLDQAPTCDTQETMSVCRSKTCENCKSGNYSCPFSTGPINQKCVECFSDISCKDGYSCKKYQCVAD